MRGIFFMFFCLTFAGCDSKVKTSKIYTSNDCKAEFKSISFKTILNSSSAYDGHPVEITGYYHGAFEMSAISSKKNIGSTKSAIWVDFSNFLSDSPNLESNDKFHLININRSKIKIKGYVDTRSQGHLGQYNCTIKDICYVEILD